jgi:hypothetical protein
MPEGHKRRLCGQALVAICVAIFVEELSDDNISVLVTALSILIGFAFAAMFPIALESVGGLPKPLYAEDRDDIKVIRQLAVYFRFNVAYFIPLSLLCVATLLVQMLSLSVPNYLKGVQHYIVFSYPSITSAGLWVAYIVPKVMIACSIMALQESCYTFYRMCFNALALLRIKEEYLASRPD